MSGILFGVFYPATSGIIEIVNFYRISGKAFWGCDFVEIVFRPYAINIAKRTKTGFC